MPTLLPTFLKTHVATQLKESLTEEANTQYYVFAGKHVAFANGGIPTPVDSYQTTVYDVYNNMVFGKRLADSDVSLVIPISEWQTNTIYTSYDSNTVIFGTPFYVSVPSTGQHDVFKVLDNNNDAPSIQAPDINETSPDDEYYQTSDGYIWKYMYSVSDAVWDKFTTDKYMPVGSNTQVEGNASPGSIDVIRVTSGGSNYDATLNAQFSVSQISVGGNPLFFELPGTASPNNDFYTDSCIYITSGAGSGQFKKITDYNGAYRRITVNSAFTTALSNTSTYEIRPEVVVDGDGADIQARCLIDHSYANSVYAVEIVNKGSNYSYATISVGGNTGGISNAAVLSPVFAPPGGHGSNAALELGASAVCIGITFANSESGTIPVSNDFRTIGLLKDPLYANVQLSLNASSISGLFTVGGTLQQVDTNARGEITSYEGATLFLTNVLGEFATGSEVYQANSTANVATANVILYEINSQSKNFDTFDQRYRLTVDFISGTFQADEQVYQNNIILANGIFHSVQSVNATAGFVNLTNVKGVINGAETIVGVDSGAIANVQGRVEPDLVKYSGEVLYLENISAVTRSNTQSEQIKIVLKF